MRFKVATVISAVALLSSVGDALVEKEDLPHIGPDVITSYKQQAQAADTGKRFESAAISKVTPGACYSPFHNAEYPSNGGSAAGLDAAMSNDFSIMRNYFSVVRTYYSSYFGYSVAKPAAENGVKLFLGVYMTTDWWADSQYTDAATAVRDYPSTIAAIMVGNENIAPSGPYSPADISGKVSYMRSKVGTSVPIGTVQRAAEWLDESRRGEMLAIANNCDVIGVNIYPFFDGNYDATSPLVLLNVIWDRMVAVYGPSKLRLTEIGYPTGGSPLAYTPRNVPSIANAKHFYDAYINWNPSSGGREAFWFMFFDRKPTDTTFQADLERYFGFFTYDKRAKAADFPVLLSALSQAAVSAVVTTAPAPTLGAPAPTQPTAPPTVAAPPPTTQAPAPTTTPPPPPTTTSPPPTTRSTPAPPPTTTAPPPTTARPPVVATATTAPTITWITLPSANLPTNVCRVRKIFY